jgi:hypothetical protein
MKAPVMPTIKPLTIFDLRTERHPSRRDFPTPTSPAVFDAAPLGISCKPHAVQAPKAKLAAFI